MAQAALPEWIQQLQQRDAKFGEMVLTRMAFSLATTPLLQSR